MAGNTKFLLVEDQIPRSWYNILSDAKFASNPSLSPRTGKPVTPKELAPFLPLELIVQEVTARRYVPIPDEVRDSYRLYRPAPLYRARRLEKALDTPAHIFYKHEGLSPIGSHKPNSALAQVYYHKQEGVKRIATMTAAGQSGSAYAWACAMFGLDLIVYMVRISYEQKPYRRAIMRTYGAEVVPSPSARTEYGRAILAQDPDSPGSAGIATSEALEDAATHPDTKFAAGSGLNHALMHHTVIGEEARIQMEMAGEYPDILIACLGAGGNFAGLVFPFLRDKLTGKRDMRAIAAEPCACPTLTRGAYCYDYVDTAGIAPMAKMYTLGHAFIPDNIHAGGLRYHGDSPIISALYHQKMIEALAYPQVPVFEAAVQFARTEGIVAAPESAHAIRCAVDVALECRERGEQKTILFCLSGVGHYDLSAYDAYFDGELRDAHLSDEQLRASLAGIPEATTSRWAEVQYQAARRLAPVLPRKVLSKL